MIWGQEEQFHQSINHTGLFFPSTNESLVCMLWLLGSTNLPSDIFNIKHTTLGQESSRRKIKLFFKKNRLLTQAENYTAWFYWEIKCPKNLVQGKQNQWRWWWQVQWVWTMWWQLAVVLPTSHCGSWSSPKSL